MIGSPAEDTRVVEFVADELIRIKLRSNGAETTGWPDAVLGTTLWTAALRDGKKAVNEASTRDPAALEGCSRGPAWLAR